MVRPAVSTVLEETFRSFRQPNYRLWFVGQGISQVGFFAQIVALALLVLNLTDDGAVLGAVMALYFVPNLVVGPWAGVLSDRLDKRRLLVITQATMMACALALGGLVLANQASLGVVIALAALTGVAFAFDQPARRTIVTELVDDDTAANAVTLNGALGQAAKLVGPAVAGVLVATVGIGWCFVLNGISSLAVLAALAAMDTTAIRHTPPLPRAPGQIIEGFRYLWTDHTARMLLGVLGVVTLVGFNWNVLLPLLAIRDLEGSSATVAVLMAAMSIGSLAGILWLARHGQLPATALAYSCVAFGIASLMLAVAPTIALATVASLLVGVTSMVLFNGGVVALQLGAAPAMRGRMMAMFGMIVLGGHALGSPTSGWIAQTLGTRTALTIGAVTSITIGLAAIAALQTRPAPHIAPSHEHPPDPATLETLQ